MRVVSSYLADLFRAWAGGDANHLRQKFPRVVLGSQEMMQGFLDGYIEGDGCRRKDRDGAYIVSANLPFLKELSEVVGSRFKGTRAASGVSTLYVPDRWHRAGWYGRHGFHAEDHRTALVESRFVKVKKVSRRVAEYRRPFVVYSFKCEPHPTFLIGGHLTHNCEHHLLPFWCDVSVGYIARSRVLGLSKFARIAHRAAHKLQLQERLVHEIADEVSRITATRDVAVLARGEHLCMTSRGVRTPALMTSSVVRGCFRTKASARAEFLSIAGGR